MRTASIVVLALLSALAAATPVKTDTEYLTRQKNIIQLFIRPQQANLWKEQADIGNSYDLEANLNNYRDAQAVKLFINTYKHNGFLPRGEVFSPISRKQIWQLERIFDVFYFAKDWDTFYRTAVWARDRLNEGQYVYALSVAIFHRPDTQDLILPPPYEIYPELFVDTTVIEKAYAARLTKEASPYIIPYNFSSNRHNYLDLTNYFTEDVGLSSYITYLNYEYPPWLNTRKYGFKIERRGELFYYTHQQLLARYQLERLSRHLPGVEVFNTDIDDPVQIGFNPQIHYHNGEALPARPAGLHVQDTYFVDVDYLKNIEWRIRDVIDSLTFVANDADGYRRIHINETNAIEILGNIIQGNADSLNRLYFKSYFYGLLAVYGRIVDPKNHLGVSSSVLEHPETAVRDPLYYNILKKVVGLFQEYQYQLPSYSRDQLAVPGVNIESVDVDKLITYYDDFYFNLNNALEVSKIEEAENLDIRVRQLRQNHKPFTVRVKVNSDKDTKVLVRFYLGPKFNYLGRELTLDEKRKFFVELDRFPFQIVSGKNTIERSSRNSTASVRDQWTTEWLLKKVNQALTDSEVFEHEFKYRHCGFPERLQLPRGTRAGLPLSFFVVITPFEGENVNAYPSVVSCGVGFNFKYADQTPFGYPFDRVIYDPQNFVVPNFYEKEVIVYHKTEEEINNP